MKLLTDAREEDGGTPVWLPTREQVLWVSKQGARFHSDIPPLPPLPSEAEVWCLTEIPRRGVALGGNRLQKQSVNVCLAAATFYTLLKHSWRHSPDTRENRLPRGTDRRTHTLCSQLDTVNHLLWTLCARVCVNSFAYIHFVC